MTDADEIRRHAAAEAARLAPRDPGLPAVEWIGGVQAALLAGALEAGALEAGAVLTAASARAAALSAALALPSSWTDPPAARLEIRARLDLMARGEPLNWTKDAMGEALEVAADAGDDVARDASEHATGTAGDALVRKWAEDLALYARPLLADLFPQPDDGDDSEPREWAGRFVAWLERCPARPSAPAMREAAELRALVAQVELPGRLAHSRLLVTLLRPDYILARLTWAWSMRALWEERSARLRDNPPALALPFAVPFAQTLRAARWDDDRRRLVDASGEPLPLVPTMPDLLPELRGLGELGSLTSHRLARWFVREGWERWAREEPEPGRLTIEGGWAALAEAIGARSKKAAGEVERVTLAWEATRVEWDAPGRSGSLPLLTGHDLVKAAPGRSARLTLFLSPMFLPGMVYKFPAGRRPPLVPVLPLPPLVGGRQTHAAQAALQLGVLAELRARAVELFERGGASIPGARWAELAREANLPRGDLLASVLDRWTQDGDDGPAFLSRDGDRWTLADAHADARDFLAAGGRRTARARAGGRLTAAKRAK